MGSEGSCASARDGPGGLAGSTLEADGQMEVVVCGSAAAEVPCYLNRQMEMVV